MKFQRRRLLLSLAFIGLAFSAMSQDSTRTFTLSGSIDVYAHTALGMKNTAFGTAAPTTSFGNLKGFSLGMANLIASYQGQKVGFVADLVFGPRGSDAVFNSGGYRNVAGVGSGQIVNQLYTYIKLSDVVTVNLGQFNTFVGYEVISPTLNANYSTSYMFSNGPFNHTGLRVDFATEGGLVAKLAVMNPTDILEFNKVNTYTLGGQIGKTTDAGGIWFNVLYGDQDGKLKKADFAGETAASYGDLFQVDLTTGWTLSDAFFLGANATYQTIAKGQEYNAAGDVIDGTRKSTSFYGVALYPKVTVSDNFALALRAEYFGVKGGTVGNFAGYRAHPLASPIGLDGENKGNVIEFTLSGNAKVGPLTLIPELRFDKTSENSFVNSDGDAKDSMVSATFAAVYKF
jgi:hypothetical protein